MEKALLASRRSPRPPTTSWLASRVPGQCRLECRCFCMRRPSSFQAAGGGENQLVQTGRHLEALGMPVRLFSPWTDRIETARLLHLFGMSREGLELARVARASGVPVVLSPICWYEPLRPGLALETGLAAQAGESGGVVPAAGDSALAELASRTARAGRSRLAQLAVRGRPARPSFRRRSRANPAVVPNGVLLGDRLGARPSCFAGAGEIEPFVLTVGRIEPRKNTLGLIRAVRPLGVPLVVIGEAPPGLRGICPGMPPRGGRSRLLAGSARPSRSPAGLGLCGGPGFRLAELV